MGNLIGLGIYTPAEAGRLLHIQPRKITRWLRGHHIGGQSFKQLWSPQIDLNDGRVHLGFRDLMEVRIADKFISYGLSPQRVRAAIRVASDMIGDARPLSTDRFRTDGRDIFFRVIDQDEQGTERERLLNLFRSQYEFREIIAPLLKAVDFDLHGAPMHWWPGGRREQILIDPARAFGQPIDAVSSVPTSILASAGKLEGNEGAARTYAVPVASVRRAVAFEATMEQRAAA